MPSRIILASASPFRKSMLQDAGLEFDQVRPDINERAVEQTVEGSGLTPADLAQLLAEAKALMVSEAHPDALVIGADQTLSLEGEILHKPADMEEARRRLLALSGRTHELHSAVVLCRGGEALWRHVSTAFMTMRQLEPGYVGRHLAAVGEAALGSVGAYQVEGQGIQLFERMEGDHFAIIGLPLLPLLAELRRLDIIDE